MPTDLQSTVTRSRHGHRYTFYKPGDAISAQTTALNGQVPANYVLENSSICSTPNVQQFYRDQRIGHLYGHRHSGMELGFIAVGSVGQSHRG